MSGELLLQSCSKSCVHAEGDPSGWCDGLAGHMVRAASPAARDMAVATVLMAAPVTPMLTGCIYSMCWVLFPEHSAQSFCLGMVD